MSKKRCNYGPNLSKEKPLIITIKTCKRKHPIVRNQQSVSTPDFPQDSDQFNPKAKDDRQDTKSESQVQAGSVERNLLGSRDEIGNKEEPTISSKIRHTVEDPDSANRKLEIVCHVNQHINDRQKRSTPNTSTPNDNENGRTNRNKRVQVSDNYQRNAEETNNSRKNYATDKISLTQYDDTSNPRVFLNDNTGRLNQNHRTQTSRPKDHVKPNTNPHHGEDYRRYPAHSKSQHNPVAAPRSKHSQATSTSMIQERNPSKRPILPVSIIVCDKDSRSENYLPADLLQYADKCLCNKSARYDQAHLPLDVGYRIPPDRSIELASVDLDSKSIPSVGPTRRGEDRYGRPDGHSKSQHGPVAEERSKLSAATSVSPVRREKDSYEKLDAYSTSQHDPVAEERSKSTTATSVRHLERDRDQHLSPAAHSKSEHSAIDAEERKQFIDTSGRPLDRIEDHRRRLDDHSRHQQDPVAEERSQLSAATSVSPIRKNEDQYRKTDAQSQHQHGPEQKSKPTAATSVRHLGRDEDQYLSPAAHSKSQHSGEERPKQLTDTSGRPLERNEVHWKRPDAHSKPQHGLVAGEKLKLSAGTSVSTVRRDEDYYRKPDSHSQSEHGPVAEERPKPTAERDQHLSPAAQKKSQHSAIAEERPKQFTDTLRKPLERKDDHRRSPDAHSKPQQGPVSEERPKLSAGTSVSPIRGDEDQYRKPGSHSQSQHGPVAEERPKPTATVRPLRRDVDQHLSPAVRSKSQHGAVAEETPKQFTDTPGRSLERKEDHRRSPDAHSKPQQGPVSEERPKLSTGTSVSPIRKGEDRYGDIDVHSKPQHGPVAEERPKPTAATSVSPLRRNEDHYRKPDVHIQPRQGPVPEERSKLSAATSVSPVRRDEDRYRKPAAQQGPVAEERFADTSLGPVGRDEDHLVSPTARSKPQHSSAADQRHTAATSTSQIGERADRHPVFDPTVSKPENDIPEENYRTKLESEMRRFAEHETSEDYVGRVDDAQDDQADATSEVSMFDRSVEKIEKAIRDRKPVLKVTRWNTLVDKCVGTSDDGFLSEPISKVVEGKKGEKIRVKHYKNEGVQTEEKAVADKSTSTGHFITLESEVQLVELGDMVEFPEDTKPEESILERIRIGPGTEEIYSKKSKKPQESEQGGVPRMKLPKVPSRYHGPGCAMEVALLEKHNKKCKFKKGNNPDRSKDDRIGSYEAIGRIVFTTCQQDAIKKKERLPRLFTPALFYTLCSGPTFERMSLQSCKSEILPVTLQNFIKKQELLNGLLESTKSFNYGDTKSVCSVSSQSSGFSNCMSWFSNSSEELYTERTVEKFCQTQKKKKKKWYRYIVSFFLHFKLNTVK